MSSLDFQNGFPIKPLIELRALAIASMEATPDTKSVGLWHIDGLVEDKDQNPHHFKMDVVASEKPKADFLVIGSDGSFSLMTKEDFFNAFEAVSLSDEKEFPDLEQCQQIRNYADALENVVNVMFPEPQYGSNVRQELISHALSKYCDVNGIPISGLLNLNQGATS